MATQQLPLTIKETHEGLKTKKFSAVELVDSYLARINKYNSEYNIFLTVADENAYKTAKELDVHYNTVQSRFMRFRKLIAEYCNNEAKRLNGELEIDETYFNKFIIFNTDRNM